jgi:hypothetical protein
MIRSLAKAAIAVATASAAGGLALPAASAAPVAVTHRAVHALTIMIERPDSGGNGNWAEDNFLREARVGTQTAVAASNCGVGATTCYQISGATLTDTDGTFTTIRGAFTPNQGAPFTGDHIRDVVDGKMSGTGDFGSFFATALPSASRVPEFNFGANNPSGTWPELFFPPGTTFTGLSEGVFSYTYHAGAQRWVDSSSDSSGQIPSAGNITG